MPGAKRTEAKWCFLPWNRKDDRLIAGMEDGTYLFPATARAGLAAFPGPKTEINAGMRKSWLKSISD